MYFALIETPEGFRYILKVPCYHIAIFDDGYRKEAYNQLQNSVHAAGCKLSGLFGRLEYAQKYL